MRRIVRRAGVLGVCVAIAMVGTGAPGSAAKSKPLTVSVAGDAESSYAIGYVGHALYVLRYADGALLRVVKKGSKLVATDLGVLATPHSPDDPTFGEYGVGFAELDGDPYVLLTTLDGVRIIQLAVLTGEPGTSVEVPGDPTSSALAAAGGKLWVAAAVPQPMGGSTIPIWDIALGSFEPGGPVTLGASVQETSDQHGHSVVATDDKLAFSITSTSLALIDATDGSTVTTIDPSAALGDAIGADVFTSDAVLVAGEGAAWMYATASPLQGLVGRIDLDTGAAEAVALPDVQFVGSIAAGEGAVWATTTAGTIYKIDPDALEVEGCITLSGVEGTPLVATGSKALWALDPATATVTRLPTKTTPKPC